MNRPGYDKRRPFKSTLQNQVRLVQGGQAYFTELKRLIDAARESIHLQAYIFDADTTGHEVAACLKAAARRQVSVYLLVDGYASRGLPRAFVEDLRAAGVQVRFFNPLFKSDYFYFGRRMHHKIVVTDTRQALVGGINISDRYNDLPGRPAWLDFAIYIEGETARELCILCWKSWKNYPPGMGLTPCEEKPLSYPLPAGETAEVAMVRNDWVRRKNEISATYVNMFRSARSQITILCSYFLPGRVIRRQLRFALSRGVRVSVITAGVSDVKLAKWAERYWYDWMVRNQIRVYEYQPTVLHGKIAVCDGEWVTIGSYNLNDISAYASIETNINVYDRRFATATEEGLLQIARQQCKPLDPDYHKQPHNPIRQLTRWISYQFFRLMFYLFTFYYKHKL